MKSSNIRYCQDHIYSRICKTFVLGPIERETHQQQGNKFNFILIYHKLEKIKFWLISKNEMKKKK